MSLAGQVALVTGGTRGIGRAISLRLAAGGADVAANYYMDREAAEKTAAEIRSSGVRAQVIQADVRDPDQIARMVGSVAETLGGLDILVSNAASGVLRPTLELKPKHWDWMMDINARALLCCAQAAVPLMQQRGRGRIIGISSLGSGRVIPDYGGVGASKAALEALIRYLAVELAPLGIVVNGVAGGAVATEVWQHFPKGEEILAAVRSRTPAGRIAEPGDIAGAVAFLCGPEAEMIRGQMLVVDGGYSLLA